MAVAVAVLVSFVLPAFGLQPSQTSSSDLLTCSAWHHQSTLKPVLALNTSLPCLKLYLTYAFYCQHFCQLSLCLDVSMTIPLSDLQSHFFAEVYRLSQLVNKSILWYLVYSSVSTQAEVHEAGDHFSHPRWAEVQHLL